MTREEAREAILDHLEKNESGDMVPISALYNPLCLFGGVGAVNRLVLNMISDGVLERFCKGGTFFVKIKSLP